MTTSQKVQVAIAIILGIAFIAIAAMYFVTPAGNLAAFVPGYEQGSTHVHVKHGIGAAILALLAFIYAWFASAKKVLAPTV